MRSCRWLYEKFSNMDHVYKGAASFRQPAPLGKKRTFNELTISKWILNYGTVNYIPVSVSDYNY